MGLSEEERNELAVSARHLLDRASGSAQVRAAVDTADGHRPEVWDEFVDLGWTSMHVPEALGGAGAGYQGLGVVLHEMGRHVTPSPFLASVVLATEALLRAPNLALAETVLPRLATGEIRATLAYAGPGGGFEPDGPAVFSDPVGGGVQLTGGADFVLDADRVDLLIVAARSAGGDPLVALVDARAPGVSVTRIPTFDRTRHLFALNLESVMVAEDHLLAPPGEKSRELIDRVLSVGTIAAACDAVGVAERVTEFTAEYASQRHQFGRPIGSFQAVKHLCADMVIGLEAARAAVRSAVEALDDPDADVISAADVVSSYCGPACTNVCGLGIRVHGGIGFTWEHDAHVFLKRAKLDEMLFGSPLWHRRRLARRVFPRIADEWARAALAG